MGAANVSCPTVHLARLAAARGAGEAGALGVDCLAGVGALVGHLRVRALQHAERPGVQFNTHFEFLVQIWGKSSIRGQTQY